MTTPAYGPRKRLRLENFDYSSKGAYFVTFNLDSDIVLGYIRETKAKYNKAGLIAVETWKKIPQYYSDIILDAYIIMPEHLHGIIFIMKDIENLNSNNGHYGLLSKIIKSYKEAVTKAVRQEYPKSEFGWQRSFYDHIIENETELEAIRKYIKENPLNYGKLKRGSK
jgi:putative transposase